MSRRLRILTVAAVAIGVGAGVAVAGAIGFVGLVAPHFVRGFVAGDPKRVLVPAGLVGAALLTAADIAVRLIPAEGEIKVGVLTAALGVPGLSLSGADATGVFRRGNQLNEPVALALKDIVVRLAGKTVIDHVCLGIRAGDFAVLVGPDGAGKTTLLRAVAGLVPPRVRC